MWGAGVSEWGGGGGGEGRKSFVRKVRCLFINNKGLCPGCKAVATYQRLEIHTGSTSHICLFW